MAQPRRPDDPCGGGNDLPRDISPIPPKVVSDLTRNEWVGTLKESRWNADYGASMVMDFLGAKKVDDISYSTYKTNIAHSLVLRFCLPDFFKVNNFTVDRVVAVESDGEYPPSFSNIEYELGKTEPRLNYGSYFIHDENGPFVVKLEEGYQDDYTFQVASHVSKSADSHKLMEKIKEYGKAHNFLIGKKLDPSCNFLKFDHQYTWDDLIIQDDLKDTIRKNLSNLIDHRELYRKNKLQVKRGLIFSGEPGCGKSTVGKILCNTIGWTFLWVTPKYLDQPKRVSQIINMCRDLAPTVLFLEDIDLYGSSRETNGQLGLLGELMNQLDGIQENTDIITIATTNKPEILEKALIDRPGRFDKVIPFPKPDIKERERMINLFAGSLLNDKVDLEILAKKTDKMTGAQMREFVNLAIIHAVDTGSVQDDKIILLPEHFDKALSEVKKKDFTPLGFSGGRASLVDYD